MSVTSGELEFAAHGGKANGARRFGIELVRGAGEAVEALRLRFRVFQGDRGSSAARADFAVDCDRFDQFCDHLIIRDLKTGRIAGTYRLLGQEAARLAGGFYSETEFDLGSIRGLAGRVLEVGRACVDPDYRSGAVISALWAGLFNYIVAHEYDYVIGCGSVPLAPGRRLAAAICRTLLEGHLSPAGFRARPYRRYPVGEFDLNADERERATAALPPLIKGYLRLGAWVCGEPAWDAEFDAADMLILLPMARLNGRYASHYRRGTSGWQPPQADSISC